MSGVSGSMSNFRWVRPARMNAVMAWRGPDDVRTSTDCFWDVSRGSRPD
jgi:hypothetical protein